MNAPLLPVGAKVVCIDDTFDPLARTFYDRLPEAGGVYTVFASCVGSKWDTGEPLPGVVLEELFFTDGDRPAGFAASRFRPREDLEEHESGQVAVSSRMTLLVLATTAS